jgi:Cu-Zn family superoxide dismutase
MRKHIFTAVAAAAAVAAASVGALMSVRADEHKDAKADAHAKAPLPTKAVAVLHTTEAAAKTGAKVAGTVTFTEKDGETTVVAEVTGLTPGLHGFHIHEFGDVSSADGMSTGGHYNPAGAPHAGPTDEKRHLGDFGNLEADKDGKATYKASFKGTPIHFILGRAVVVHAKADDLKTQPSGDAGGRIAVGVIGVAKP